MNFGIAAVITAADIAAKSTGFTLEDCPGSFALDTGLEMTAVTVIIIRKMKNILYFKTTQESHLQSVQRDLVFWTWKKLQDAHK